MQSKLEHFLRQQNSIKQCHFQRIFKNVRTHHKLLIFKKACYEIKYYVKPTFLKSLKKYQENIHSGGIKG